MVAFLIRRAIFLILVLLALTWAVWYFGVHTYTPPPEYRYLIPPEPFRDSFSVWLQHLLRGDLNGDQGRTLKNLWNYSSASLLLFIPAFVLQLALVFGSAIPIADRADTWLDRAFTAVASIATAFPAFCIGLLLAEWFAVKNQWLPLEGLVSPFVVPTGFYSPAYGDYLRMHPVTAQLDLARHLLLPVFTLVFASFPADALVIRTTVRRVLGEEYIRAARARGLRRRVILWKHALRAASAPIIAALSLNLPRFLFLQLVVEFVFQIPGLGFTFGYSVYRMPNPLTGVIPPRDIMTLLPYFLGFIAITLLCTLLADILSAFADPRVGRVRE